MTISTILVVSLVGCALAWENLPAIPAGRRAEYYLLHNDGGYKYGYDTGEGQSAVVSADPNNQVQGEYQYEDKSGSKVSLAYTAGEAGFVPQSQTSTRGSKTGSRLGGVYEINDGSGTGLSSSSGHDPSSVDPDYDANADASYSFTIDTDNYKRTETADSKGNVRGQYSYSSNVGGSQSVSYIAGEGTGFVVNGGDSNSVAVPSNTPASSVGNSYGTPLSAPSNAYGTPLSVPSNAYGAPVAPPTNVYGAPVAPPTNVYGAPVASPTNVYGAPVPGVSGYAFSYVTPDQAREESADALNNVRGSYSFKAKDDGQTRRVEYTAGAATGFVAQGSHLPVPPTSAQGYSSAAPVPPLGHSSSPVFPPSPSLGYTPVAPLIPTPVQTYSPVTTQENHAADGSYSFSYETGDHSRQESGDAQNNVRGSFSFKAKDDGQTRRVDYEAGAATGFVAKGAHLPVAPTSASIHSTGLGGQSSAGSVGGYTTSGSFDTETTYPSTYPTSGEEESSGDASYSFSYDAGSHARQESSDAKGNVIGQFSFVSGDGVPRKVEYTAGPGKGFIAKGAHLPVDLPTSASSYSSSTGDGQYSNAPSTKLSPVSTFSNAPSTSYSTVGSAPVTSNGLQNDGSYSFSYNAADHGRQESGDAQNNVRGSFSFKSKDDGQTRRVDYEAGAATGFVAKGTHLPVPPSPSSQAGVGPTGHPAQTQQNFRAGGYSSQDSVDNSGQGAAYSYNYQTDSSSKQETSDAQGNVVGSFSFVGGDGISRSVQYTSRGDEGFVASGAHLPTAGEASSAGTVGAAPFGSALSPGFQYSAGSRILHSKAPAAFRLDKYLPPESPQKFGYIFDSKV